MTTILKQRLTFGLVITLLIIVSCTGCTSPNTNGEASTPSEASPDTQTLVSTPAEVTEKVVEKSTEPTPKELKALDLSKKIAKQDLLDHQEIVDFYRSAKLMTKAELDKIAKEKKSKKEKAEEDKKDTVVKETHEHTSTTTTTDSSSTSSSSNSENTYNNDHTSSSDSIPPTPEPEPEPVPEPEPDPAPPFEPYYSASIGSHGLYDSYEEASSVANSIEDEYWSIIDDGGDPGWNWSGWEVYPVRHYYAPGESKLYYTVNFY